jgi:hypothetical protein
VGKWRDQRGIFGQLLQFPEERTPTRTESHTEWLVSCLKGVRVWGSKPMAKRRLLGIDPRGPAEPGREPLKR